MTNIVLVGYSSQFSSWMDNNQLLVDEVYHELMQQGIRCLALSSSWGEDDYRLDSRIIDTIANEIWRDYEKN